MLHTSAIRRKAYQEEGIIRITQDVVRAIQVLPGRSCTLSFAIQAVSRAMSMHVQHIRWVFSMFLAVLTSDSIASKAKRLTVQVLAYSSYIHDRH